MNCQTTCCGQKCQTPIAIEQNVPLKNKNWFRTGGNAAYWCEPTTATQMRDALRFAEDNNLPMFVLGEGANVLISDEGFNGLVIHPCLKAISIAPHDDNHVLVRAGAGCTINDLIEFCLANQILGLEEFSGIPGSVGGALYINLHYFDFLIAQFLHEAHVISKEIGARMVVDPAWFQFGYNQSTLQNGNFYLIDATFKLRRGTELECAYARGRRDEIIKHRTRRYPSQGTCGSFFRNFHDNEVTIEINGKKMISVAYYLDKVGVKGALTVGDAGVSYQHANMIVNRANASTNDILEVAKTMQRRVYEAFGVIPQTECLLIGFKENPFTFKP